MTSEPLNRRVKISKTGRPYVGTKDLVNSALERTVPKCEACGHNNVNNKGECRQCIDWQKHVCAFPENAS